ncbi:DUF4232 domain-containing protein [Streptomyces sp. AV19]|uniref:DUF4232 domain-containing protein n=1 Tax=Streptomyces sp. AV19 TaxID=2793068 RepID=UPI0018FE65E4|nr:DUF4232 domain-containing protein [Streptomyces sp. AV19]MBH1937599.1 DUF4232 domain-containing protein [Streptomyces sp. AV19]MDG4536468.1 DUF4232 domain-containing protein [Streptomyces sp. AV19]
MRTATRSLLPAAFASVLLLTACGTGTQGSGVPGPGTAGSGSAAPVPGDPSDLEKDGVRVTGMGGRTRSVGPPVVPVEFAVTNREDRPFTYTVALDVLSASGEVLANTKETVPSVPAGRTVRRTVRIDTLRSGAERVRLGKVRRVPSDEAPAGAHCPPSGFRLTADDGDAAMGLRVVGLHLENCGTRPRRLDGHPLLELLDEDRKPVPGVDVLRGGGDIALVTGFDDPPRPVDLKPGETGFARLMWRNTTGAGDPVNVPYVRVRAEPGSRPLTVIPELDLGTTGKLGVSAWTKGSRP